MFIAKSINSTFIEENKEIIRMIKKIISVGLLSAFFTIAFGYPQVNIIWVGNSLTQGGFCSEGWRSASFMCNPDSNRTHKILADKDCMAGATRLATHWANKSAVTYFANPEVWNPRDLWQKKFVDSYQYIVLQPYNCHDAASIASEKQALINYCDTALSWGIKPVLFACWESPDMYTAVMKMYVDVWNMYKDRGALLAPLFDAHRLALQTKPTSYLYGGDTWEHETNVAAYMHGLIFNYLFAGVKPTDFNLPQLQSAVWPYVNTINQAVVDDADFLEQQAEAALALYYDLNSTTIAPCKSLKESPLNSRSGSSRVIVDIRGRVIPQIGRRAIPGCIIAHKAVIAVGIRQFGR
jgi:hypothetical protein